MDFIIFIVLLRIGHYYSNWCYWVPYVLPFDVQLHYSSKKIVGRIACKSIWLLNVLPFCVEQDVPFEVLDSCIDCKSIWFLYELPYYV